MDREFAHAAIAVVDDARRVRSVAQRCAIGQPSAVVCLHAAHLTDVYDSADTFESGLKAMQTLLSFAEESSVDIEGRPLQVERIEPRQIWAFVQWLEQSYRQENGILPRAVRGTLNAILRQARIAKAWFITMYWAPDNHLARGYEVQNVLATQRTAWAQVTKCVKAKPIAPDLEDDIRTIDIFLSNATSGQNAEHRSVRASLIWRLAIEFGMRIGEILALRVEDRPIRHRKMFEIVSIDDRNQEVDPRGFYAPRPKTIGRSLGILLPNSVFPGLIPRYISGCRVTWSNHQTTRSCGNC